MKAINSILTQSGVNAVPLVVVNGNRFDEDLNESLKKHPDIKYIYLTEGNQAKAVYHGVRKVDTAYFAFLDDDDIYLDNALIIRLRPMLKDQDVGLSVTSGYKHGIGEKFLLPFDEKVFALNPVAALLKSPWLSSCSGLYRRSLIPASLFDHDYRYLEWTYLAFAISRNIKVAFTNSPTFLINFSENSLSSSPLMEVTRSCLMAEIAQDQTSEDLKKQFLNKKYAAYHMASEIYLKNHEIGKAWKYHLLCLINIQGIRYVSYTYKLCRFSFPKRKSKTN